MKSLKDSPASLKHVCVHTTWNMDITLPRSDAISDQVVEVIIPSTGGKKPCWLNDFIPQGFKNTDKL